jgi:hypothetical protein
MSVKFQMYYVSDGAVKAPVLFYSLDNHVSGKPCVTICAKDYSGNLGKIPELRDGYQNDTDVMTDYFDHGRVRLFENHPLYAAARARAEANLEVRKARGEARAAKRRERCVGACIDCGRLGARTGHQDCEYPGRFSDQAVA